MFDPKGGYWKPGGKFMPSLIAKDQPSSEHRKMIRPHQETEPMTTEKELVASPEAHHELGARQDTVRRGRQRQQTGTRRAALQLCASCRPPP